MALLQGDHLPTLTAPDARVHLRWLLPDDVSALHEIFSNAEVMRYWSRPPFTDGGHAEARALLASIQRAFTHQTLFQWGVARREDDRVIGTCTLASVDASNLRAELGYALGRDHWGHGLMGEALGLLLPFAFDVLGLRRLEADVDPRNAPSIRTLDRLGFRREGLLRARWLVAGEVQDSALYGLLRDEWPRARAAGRTPGA